jgi:hypothetical protein
VYDELRKLAAAKLAQEKPGQTLQPTALQCVGLVRGTLSPPLVVVGWGKDNAFVFFINLLVSVEGGA